MTSGGRGGELIPFQKYLIRDSGGEVALVSLRKYIAVRFLTGWTGWILDIYISNYEKPKTLLVTSNPYNEFLFLCEQKWNSIIRIFLIDTHRTLFVVWVRQDVLCYLTVSSNYNGSWASTKNAWMTLRQPWSSITPRTWGKATLK